MPSSILLCCLHEIIQVSMGWTDTHMHQFSKDKKRWGMASFDEFNEIGLLDEKEVKLSQVLKVKGQSMIYEYDFGDNWRHKVLLEDITPVYRELSCAVCQTGSRNCPPEDVGGAHGYAMFLESLKDPENEDFEDIMGWYDDGFDPAAFDLKELNKLLSEMQLPLPHLR